MVRVTRRFAPPRWPSLAERHRITRRGDVEESVVLWVGLAVLIVLLMILAVGR